MTAISPSGQRPPSWPLPQAMVLMDGVHLLHGRNELAEHFDVIVGLHAPDLVIDLPILDAVGVGMAVGGAYLAPLRSRGGVAVLDEVARILDVLRAFGRVVARRRC